MRIANSRILITGGSGFIGTNLIEFLLVNNAVVLNYDFASPRNVKHRHLWQKGDLLDYKCLKGSILDFAPNYVIHLAARTDLEGQSLSDYSANIEGVENLVGALKDYGRCKRLIAASSMLVCKLGYKPLDVRDTRPNTWYGRSKVVGEKILLESRLSCEIVIVRPTSIWGPWFSEPYKRFFELVIAKRYFHFGGSNNKKTFGFVGNTVLQISYLLFEKDLNLLDKPIYYLGDNPAIAIRDWAELIASHSKSKIYRIPYFIIWSLSKVGDFLVRFGINFPITSFRLKNMTTDNVISLESTKFIMDLTRYSTKEGVVSTLEWLHNGYSLNWPLLRDLDE